MYDYNEALKNSVEYFGGNELAAKVFLDKYALRNNESNLLEKTPDQMHRRIAKEFARIEKKKFKKPLLEEEIFSYLDRFKYIVPQGSPMYGIGNSYQYITLSNCYLLDVPEDCYSSILRIDQQLVNISKRRGGVGIDLSKLRPKGAPTKNAARSSTGIVSWMERYSNSIREVGQSGRRGALMLTISIHHPDIMDFITIKNDLTKVTGANISVRLSNEFLKAVENNEEYELRFPIDYKEKKIKPQYSIMKKAREVWKSIIHSAWLRAEPGMLMWDNIVDYTPADCYEEYASKGTNPCSELNLAPLDSCRLISMNLFSYVDNPFTEKSKFNFDLFSEHAKAAERLMDDLVDLESEKIDLILEKIKSDPEEDYIKKDEIDLWKKIKKNNDSGRRTGLGITALGDTLAALGIKYGSDESIKKIEKIYRTLKLSAYRSSVDMAKELGTFIGWDGKKEVDCEFIKRIKSEDEELYKDMMKHGRRNVSLLTTAPAGSISLLTQTTSGIEPLWMLEPHIRRKKINPSDKDVRVDFVDQNGDSWQEYKIYHSKVNDWMKITGEKNLEKSPWYKCCAEDLDWKQRVKLQAAAQKHVCHSISSTINLPEDVTENKVAEIYEMAWKSGCKGITIYRANCRSGVLVEASKSASNSENINKIQKTRAPKRPDSLISELYHITVNNHHYYAALGFYNEDLYEIFTGNNQKGKEEFIIPKTVKYGKISKRSRGKYVFEHLNEETKKIDEYHLTNGHNDETADALTRILSCALRHGADLSFIVHQLEKTTGSIMSFAKVLARTLKKYIKDGTGITGESCPTCGEEKMVRQSGCKLCMACGYSGCS